LVLRAVLCAARARRKFCGVNEAEFERRGFHSLSESFPIERRLDGTVKPYDVVALFCALSGETSRGDMFGFRAAKQATNIHLFGDVTHLVPSGPFVEVFHQCMLAVARSKTAGFARFKPARAETEGPLTKGVSMASFVRLAKK
jgi:hypothetical protein